MSSGEGSDSGVRRGAWGAKDMRGEEMKDEGGAGEQEAGEGGRANGAAATDEASSFFPLFPSDHPQNEAAWGRRTRAQRRKGGRIWDQLSGFGRARAGYGDSNSSGAS